MFFCAVPERVVGFVDKCMEQLLDENVVLQGEFHDTMDVNWIEEPA